MRSRLLPLLVALSGAAAGAEETGVFAVAEPPGPDAHLVALTTQLRAALASRMPAVLDAAALLDRVSGRAPPTALADLDRAYAEALAAHVSGDYEGANRTLRSVVDALEALPEAPEVFEAWTRAQLRLARSEQELGRGVTAQAVLERLLRATPELNADPRQYPPSFQGLVDDARARLRAQGVHRLTVESHPSARVFVEGRDVGTTPVTIERWPGRYRVAGSSGGIVAPVQQVDLSEDRLVQLDLSLLGTLMPEDGPGIVLTADRQVASLPSLGARLGLDRLVATTLLQEGRLTLLSASVFDVRRGTIERTGRIVVERGMPPATAMEALASYLATGAPTPLANLGEEGTGGAAVTSITLPVVAPSTRPRPWAVWAAVASGLAATTTGVLFAVEAADAAGHYATARAMLGPSGLVVPPGTVVEYNALIHGGDRSRNWAIGLGVVSGVTLLATLVFGYVAYREGGEGGAFRF